MKKSRIKQISPQKKKHNELYRKSKKELLEELRESQGIGPKDAPLCVRCLSNQGDAFHHAGGRSGVLLWHKPFLFWMCNDCHVIAPNAVHNNPSKAREEGFIIDLTRDQYEEIRKIEQPKLYE